MDDQFSANIVPINNPITEEQWRLLCCFLQLIYLPLLHTVRAEQVDILHFIQLEFKKLASIRLMETIGTFGDIVFPVSVSRFEELSKQNPSLDVEEDVLLLIVFKILQIVRWRKTQTVL